MYETDRQPPQAELKRQVNALPTDRRTAHHQIKTQTPLLSREQCSAVLRFLRTIKQAIFGHTAHQAGFLFITERKSEQIGIISKSKY